MTDPRLDIRSHLATDGLAMWTHRGTSDRLVVSLSGIGPSPDGVQPYEFASTATGNGRDHALFVSDARRSWLNAPGLIERIVEEVEGLVRRLGVHSIVTLGHSMGGFAAMVLPGFTRIDCAVAFTPQMSVHPDIVGDDPRWMQHRGKIDNFRIRSVNDHLTAETAYFMFHGGHKREAPQRDRFELHDNTVQFIFDRAAHNVPQQLKRAGVQQQVLDLAVRNRRRKLRQLLAPLGARRRKAGDVQFRPPVSSGAPSPIPADFSLQETAHDQI